MYVFYVCLVHKFAQISDYVQDFTVGTVSQWNVINFPSLTSIKFQLFLLILCSGSVFSATLHPSKRLAVTGAEDDKAYVWDTEDGHIVFECVGKGFIVYMVYPNLQKRNSLRTSS